MTLLITSPQNPRIKRVIKLNDRRARDEAQQTVVEGGREVALALRAGIRAAEAYICPELLDSPATQEAAARLRAGGAAETFDVSADVFAKMAYRGGSGGLLLVIPYQTRTLDGLVCRAEPFVVVVEEAEKPGNLGAILRTADAAGVDAVVIPTAAGQTGTDLNNPNVIRASLGAYFTVPLIAAPATELIAAFRQRGIAIVAATPAADTLYTAAPLAGPVAVAVGSEAWGLSDTWLAAADQLVRIPMAGAVDSLNLATSAALLMYEVVRQRGV